MSDVKVEEGFRLAEGVAILSRTPQCLRSLLQGLPRYWQDASEGGEQWTPLQVLGHLVEAEAPLWIPRARVILGHGESRSFEPFDRFTHLEKHRDTGAGRVAPGNFTPAPSQNRT